MRFRSPLTAVLLVLLTAGLWFWTRPPPPPANAPGPGAGPQAPAVAGTAPAASPSAPGGRLPAAPAAERALPGPTGPAADAGGPYDPAAFPIAARLNAPGATVAADLNVLQELLDTWRTNFPREGNPVGENADITAALLGTNRLELALVPRRHPALNANGELQDRWGTPYRFHQLSGERMEITSAGPDRRFGTDDDTTLTPP
ncbi:MAG: hypothetical protein ACO3G4_02025 [Opitutaceae bacterium]